jgi:hypothetical protein
MLDEGGVMCLVPERPLRAYRRIGRGINPKGVRDKNDVVR